MLQSRVKVGDFVKSVGGKRIDIKLVGSLCFGIYVVRVDAFFFDFNPEV